MKAFYESVEDYQKAASQVLGIESVINACKEIDTLFIKSIKLLSISKTTCTFEIPKQFLKVRRILSFNQLNKGGSGCQPIYPKDLFCIRINLRNKWANFSPEAEMLKKTLSAKNVWCAHATLGQVKQTKDWQVKVTLKIKSYNFEPPDELYDNKKTVIATIEILEKLLPEK